MVMKIPIFWDITTRGPLTVNRSFGETFRFHLQVRRMGQARNQREAGSKESTVDFQRTTWFYISEDTTL
jgi:hypothetical protein